VGRAWWRTLLTKGMMMVPTLLDTLCSSQVASRAKGAKTIVSYPDPTERAHLLESQRSKHTVGRNVICADAAEG
jgi:hypothetical protein